MPLIEIPVAVLLGLAAALRGRGARHGQTAPPARDWLPILWFGGFTLGVLAIAVIFLRTAHPFCHTGAAVERARSAAII